MHDSSKLSLCWDRAASGPFFGEQFISTQSGFKMGFCQWAEMGPKVVLGCRVGAKWVETHFFTHLKPIRDSGENPIFYYQVYYWNNRKGGAASLRSRTCVKRNAAFGARCKGLSLHFLYQNGKLIPIKTGLDTYLIRIQTRTPL